jgi:hypothetical protein
MEKNEGCLVEVRVFDRRYRLGGAVANKELRRALLFLGIIAILELWSDPASMAMKNLLS